MIAWHCSLRLYLRKRVVSPCIIVLAFQLVLALAFTKSHYFSSFQD